MKFNVKVADGKYTVYYDNGKLYSHRYGEPWRDHVGDKLIYFLAEELNQTRALLEDSEAALRKAQQKINQLERQ